MTTLSHKCLLPIMGLFCLLASAPAFAANAVVHLRAGASIDREEVLLGDIARIECGDVQLAARLEKVQIAKVALPGQTRWIHPGQVEMHLNRLGRGTTDQVQLIARAGPVKVTRNYLKVSEESISSAIKAYIDKNAPWDRKQMKVVKIHCPVDVKVPNGKITMEIKAPKHADWLGQMTFQVGISVDGEPARRISATASIEVLGKVVVTAKPLGRGEPIGPDDIKVVTMDLSRAPLKAVLDPREVSGGLADKAIAVNTVLRRDSIRFPPLVHRGDVVRVLAQSGALTISTRGLAKEDGGRGENIRLVNLRSRKNIHAKVIDSGTVQVDFQ